MNYEQWEALHKIGHEFAEKLNAGKFVPKVNEGTVSLLVQPLGHEMSSEQPATEEELAALGFDRGFVDGHPGGVDRGGYVPFVVRRDGARAFWTETWSSAD